MEQYIKEFETIGKVPTAEDGLINYHVKIGDIKKIIKRDSLKHNYELGIEMVNSYVYDLINMGFILLDTKSISSDEIISLSRKIKSPYIIERHVTVFVAENKDYKELLKYFHKNNLNIYYGAITGLVSMDPEYNIDFLNKVLNEISANIKTHDEKVIKDMNYCLATIAIQVPALTTKALNIYDGYKDDLELLNIHNARHLYDSAKNRNQLAKKRKTCRC